MKYTNEIIINQPIDNVIKSFDNAENMKHWQKGLVNYKLISGEEGKEGAKTELNYKMGKREVTLVETILTNNLPQNFLSTYATKGVLNTQKNYFEDAKNNTTKWASESEFKFSGFGMKLMGFLMPGAFKKQSLTYMNDFKAFAETGKSVLDS